MLSTHTLPPPGFRLDRLHPLSRGLLAWWPFNEGGGSLVYDVVAGQTGAFINGSVAGWTGSRFGGALSFNGTNQYLDHLPAMDVTIGAGDITWSCWFNLLDASANRRLFYLGDAGTSTNYLNAFVSTSNVLTFQGNAGSNGNVTHQTSVVLDRWYHAAFTRMGSTAQVYLNGVPSATATDANLGVSVGSDHLIGSFRNATLTWSGSIADVRLWGRVLGEPDIRLLYQGNPFGLVSRAVRPTVLGAATPGGTLTPGHTYQYRKWAAWHQSFSA